MNATAIEQAAARLKGLITRTPLLESDRLNARLGGRLLVKAENLQRGGSFKFRGACHGLLVQREQDPQRLARSGVVTYSSGNHARALALAARLFEVPAVIVMPSDAPAIKRQATEALGARIVPYDRRTECREAIAEAIAADTGALRIPPFDHPDVIAGQGTVGLEMVDACRHLDVAPDLVLAPCSGGGLVAGVGMALRSAYPTVQLWAVEPAGYEDTRLSLERGERIRIAPRTSSLCDALLLHEPGRLTFEINRRQLTGALAVDDAAVLDAMATAMTEFKLVLEPGGAAALAAVLSGAMDIRDRIALVVASGGNVDPPVLARALARIS